MDFQYIGRLAMPHFRRFKTESEITTLQFMAEQTTIPAPEVYAWDADPDNSAGAENILLKKIPGERPSDRWEGFSEDEKKRVIGQLVDIQLQFLHTTFDKVVSLFKNTDNDSYEVGILVDQLLYLGTHGKMKIGPTEEYLIGLLRSTSTFLDRPDALNDDDCDERHIDRIRNACQRPEEAIPTIPSFQPMDASPERFCLQHTGLHMVEGTKVTGIIESEEAGVYPAWVFGESHSLVSGPDVIDDGVHREGYYREEHLWLLEKTKYRHFFHSEINGRDQEFKAVVEEAGELVRCKVYTTLSGTFQGTLCAG
ncbi:hypothetical protein BGX34_009132 [Mortierella sp. NVP85]|nr:hypothetical protein BGX34_009132 [Mortierella sp. NVP85]